MVLMITGMSRVGYECQSTAFDGDLCCDLREDYPNVLRYIRTCLANPAVADVLSRYAAKFPVPEVTPFVPGKEEVESTDSEVSELDVSTRIGFERKAPARSLWLILVSSESSEVVWT